jgi:hypothetical protein
MQFGIGDITMADVDKITELLGDAAMNYISTKTARILAVWNKENPVYEYRYDHVGSFTDMELFSGGMMHVIGRVRKQVYRKNRKTGLNRLKQKWQYRRCRRKTLQTDGFTLLSVAKVHRSYKDQLRNVWQH